MFCIICGLNAQLRKLSSVNMKFLITACFILIAALKITAKCPERAVDPVCASDKKVYANRCLVKQNDLEVVDWNQCSCKRGCTKEYDPVCGSNGGIYSNRCLLLTAACETKGDIREAPKARCCKCPNCDKNPPCKNFCNRTSVDDENQEKDNEKPTEDGESDKTVNQKSCGDKCERPCPFIYKPVCGGCGKKYKIYSNSCLLEIAKCRNKDIREVDMSKCDTQCPEKLNA